MLSPRRFSALDLTAIIVWVAAVTSLPSRDALQGTQPGAFCVPDGWQSGRAVTLAVTAKNSAKPTVTRVSEYRQEQSVSRRQSLAVV